MFCTDWIVKQARGERIYAEPLPCRCWSCPRCHRRRRNELIRDGIDGSPNTFITLTVNPAVGKTPDFRARLLVHSWRAVRKKAIKKYGYRTIPFMAIFEKTKRGEPHLHIIARTKWIDQAWLSNQMRRLASSPIVDIRRITDTGRAVHYVTKYVGKEPAQFQGCKRYWRSLDYLPHTKAELKANRTASELWQVEQTNLNIWIWLCKEQGRTVEKCGHGYLAGPRTDYAGVPPRPPPTKFKERYVA